MSQHDYVIANQTFPATRTDLNNAFGAIVSQNSGATAPSTTYAYQLWYDTTANKLKQRNADNDAWIDLFDVDQVADTASPSTGGGGTTGIDDNSTATTITIDSSNNVGIGQSSPNQKLDVNGNIVTDSYSLGAGNGIFLRRGFETNAQPSITVEDHSGSAPDGLGVNGGDGVSFRTGGTERMRLDGSGNVLVGTTSNPGSGDFKTVIDFGSVGRALALRTTLTSTRTMQSFFNGNGEVGRIDTSGSSTSYVTSSDYRLKTDVTYDWDATSRLKQLKPARFAWIADGDEAVPVDGFLAHEVQDVVPEAISGTKDAVDEDGNPVYQGIDQSKLTPLLTKALIEAVEKIEQLEARITALEAS